MLFREGRRPRCACPVLAAFFAKDGVSDFDALHSRKHNKRDSVPSNAFDMLAGDGKDYQSQALCLRKANLTRLLKRCLPGIFIAEYEQGDIGHDLFLTTCKMGLEGFVSKRPIAPTLPAGARTGSR
jgi:ATP-dependent DNA ligase